MRWDNVIFVVPIFLKHSVKLCMFACTYVKHKCSLSLSYRLQCIIREHVVFNCWGWGVPGVEWSTRLLMILLFHLCHLLFMLININFIIIIYAICLLLCYSVWCDGLHTPSRSGSCDVCIRPTQLDPDDIRKWNCTDGKVVEYINLLNTFHFSSTWIICTTYASSSSSISSRAEPLWDQRRMHEFPFLPSLHNHLNMGIVEAGIFIKTFTRVLVADHYLVAQVLDLLFVSNIAFHVIANYKSNRRYNVLWAMFERTHPHLSYEVE